MTFPQQFPPAQPQGFPQQPPAQQFPGAPAPQAFPGQPQGLPPFPQAAPAEPVRSVDEFMSGGGKSINFGKPGEFKRLNAPFGGKVVSAKVDNVTNFNTKQIERWPDGRAKEQLVVVLDTIAGPYPEREDANDDGKRTLYVKGSMVNPFRQAVQSGNGGTGAVTPGGLLVGCHTGTNGQAYTWAFQWDPSGQGTGAPAAAPQAPAQPSAAPVYAPPMPQTQGTATAPAQQSSAFAQAAAPEVAQINADQAAAFAAWQAQQAQAAQPAAPVQAPAQPGQAFNPFAQ